MSMRLFRPEALKPPRDFVAPVLPVDRPVLAGDWGGGRHARAHLRKAKS